MKTILPRALLAVLLLLGCGRGRGTDLSQERFVDVMVELRQAAEQARGDTASFALRRDQVLSEAGVTHDQLQAYVEARGHDLRHMAEVWEAINARLSERPPVDPDIQ